ncbi:MAG: SET domain-containing protein [Candidatus Staskawiczbacteria bacterium]
MNKIKQKILKDLKNTCCRLRASKIEGVGVFAIKDIPKGKDPFPGIKNGKWHKFDIKELKNLDKTVLAMIDDFFVIEDNSNVYIPEIGLNGIDISFFLNNSKNPNLKIVGDGKDEAVFFKTAKNIKKGEELTVSYATYDKKYI